MKNTEYEFVPLDEITINGAIKKELLKIYSELNKRNGSGAMKFQWEYKKHLAMSGALLYQRKIGNLLNMGIARRAPFSYLYLQLEKK